MPVPEDDLLYYSIDEEGLSRASQEMSLEQSPDRG
jgi:hypothetical protein